MIDLNRIRSFLTHPDQKIALNAAKIALRLGDRTGINVLEKLLHDPKANSLIKIEAAAALNRTDIVEQYVCYENIDISIMALVTLGRTEEALTKLRKFIFEDKTSQANQAFPAALEALAKFGNQQDIAALK